MLTRLLIGAVVLFASLQAGAQDMYKIAIIIDDLGNNFSKGEKLINMPYQMTYAILPDRPYSVRLANLAAESGKEVMVHLPMQSSQHQELGNNGLTIDLSQEQFKQAVIKSIDAVPHAKGVNNHMGSLLTRHPGHMTWLMEVLSLKGEGFYFVDSKTTARTIASQIAREHFVPNITRDVFIDSSQNESDIKKQLEYLTRLAKENGYAVGIGHPYSATIKILVKYLPTLTEHNIEIVPVAKLVELNTEKQWPRYSFRLPTVVKN